MTPEEMLAEASKLLDDKPLDGERVDFVQTRLVHAQWLIAKADLQRVRTALDAPHRAEVLATLTDDERRFLAMHARYESEGQLDARRYVCGVHEDGAMKLNDQWASRQERADRWRVIADALSADLLPTPWGSQGRRESHG